MPSRDNLIQKLTDSTNTKSMVITPFNLNIKLKEKQPFYNNLTDAVRALFVWQRCRVVLQKGKVKLE